jgi:hypothetical protein
MHVDLPYWLWAHMSSYPRGQVLIFESDPLLVSCAEMKIALTTHGRSGGSFMYSV